MAPEEVGTVVGTQGSLVFAAAGLLHLTVGVQQPLFARSSFGPAAPEGSKEPMAPLAEVGREKGVQLLPVQEAREGVEARGRGPAWGLTSTLPCPCLGHSCQRGMSVPSVGISLAHKQRENIGKKGSWCPRGRCTSYCQGRAR